MNTVRYFERPEIVGQKFFECETLRGSLSVSSCSARWLKANDPTGGDKANRCFGCELGASHAGRPNVVRSMIRDSKVCARCLRPYGRLIHGTICVSCYNRQREAEIGKNAKGQPPSKTTPLDDVSVLYKTPLGVRNRVVRRCSAPIEAALSVVHEIASEARFAFVSGYRQSWSQLGLFA